MVGVEELGAFTQIGAFWVNHRSCCHVNMGQFTGKVSRVWSGAAQPSPPLHRLALRVSPKSLLCHSPVAERPIDIGGFESLEHQVNGTNP
jgi:hypothetical protein